MLMSLCNIYFNIIVYCVIYIPKNEKILESFMIFQSSTCIFEFSGMLSNIYMENTDNEMLRIGINIADIITGYVIFRYLHLNAC